tara:strand:- start:11509 stop:12342 length:834 start_codon:yes stop_codon:yes gene_type:complete
MAIRISHSILHRNQILILALVISLFVHALFVLLSPKPSEISQPASSARISVAMNWSQNKSLEIDALKREQEIKPSASVEKNKKLQKAAKPDKSIIKTMNTAVIRKESNGAAKPNKTIQKQVKTDTNVSIKMQNNLPIQNPKQEVDIAESSSKSLYDAIQKQQTTEQAEPLLEESLDEKSASLVSRFQIGSNANPKPKYPSLAAKRGWQGEVILGVHVRADGSIEHLSFVKSTNYGVLNFEAYETVRTSWHFKALEDEDDQTQSTYIEVPITFNIANR